jgi:hypothetical protein
MQMNHTPPNPTAAPHPYETYEEILDRDSRPVPRILREYPGPDIGVEPVAPQAVAMNTAWNLSVSMALRPSREDMGSVHAPYYHRISGAHFSL